MKQPNEMTDREFQAEYGADISRTQAAVDAAKGRASDKDAWEAIWRLQDRLEPGWRAEEPAG